MQIKDVMTRHIVSVSPNTRLTEVGRVLRDNDVGCVAVRKDSDFIGMITDRDIVVRCIAEETSPNFLKAGDVMSTNVVFCIDSDTTDKARTMMKMKSIHRLFVKDRFGKIVGIISMSDIDETAMRTPVCRVVFYKNLANSYGMVKKVPMTTIFVPSAQSPEAAIDFAIRKLETDHKNRWNTIADEYEVLGSVDPNAAIV